MKTCARILLALSFLAIPLFAADNADADYIKVEVKGTLETGLMAIGGETTGTIIRVKNVTWELDFGDNPQLRDLAAKLNKKAVVLTGTYEKRKGVEIRERHIVKVATLKPAGN